MQQLYSGWMRKAIMFQATAKFLRVTLVWIIFAPYVVFYLGAASNQLVLIANHDKFPVMLNAKMTDAAKPDSYGLIDNEHCVMTTATHLNVLADIFDLHDGWYSIGDGLIVLGEWMNNFCIFVWMALLIQKLRATNERQTESGSRNS